jgi:MHS family citrate/tricarballylate:H+ symporter-like MFS transporter
VSIDFAQARHEPIAPRQVAAAVAGNALEFYDFTIYAFFAVQIGHNFFPNHSAFVSLMLSLATFGAGFILRPLGAIVIGRFADRRGRKPAMLFSFALMGLAILGVALTPSYSVIGPIAPVLVLFWRLCQGFALGGEVGPTTAYLVEASPPRKRGLYGAWQGGSQNMASVAGGLVGVTLATVAGAASLEIWGWRVAFLLGAAVLPFGLLLRRGLPETLHRPETIELALGRDSLRDNARVLALGFGLVAAMTVSTYVFNFMTTYAMTTLHMAAGISLAATLVSGSCGLAGGLIGGWLSDRVGRRALMVWPRIFFIAVTWPAFYLMVKNHDAVTLLGATAVMTFSSALSTAAGLVAITESLGKKIRGMGMGAIYATAVAIFGGTTQPILAALIHYTGDPLAPAWYTIAFTVIGLIASIAMRESAHGMPGPR